MVSNFSGAYIVQVYMYYITVYMYTCTIYYMYILHVYLYPILHVHLYHILLRAKREINKDIKYIIYNALLYVSNFSGAYNMVQVHMYYITVYMYTCTILLLHE